MARAYREEWVTVNDVVCMKATDLALLCELPDGREVWIPQSHIGDDSEVYDDSDNNRGKLVITAWLAKQKSIST